MKVHTPDNEVSGNKLPAILKGNSRNDNELAYFDLSRSSKNSSSNKRAYSLCNRDRSNKSNIEISDQKGSFMTEIQSKNPNSNNSKNH